MIPAVWLLLFSPFQSAANPASFDQLLAQGLVALNSNDLGSARDRLDAATKLNPQSGEAWIALAQTHLKLKDIGSADSAAKRAEALAGNNPRLLRALLIYYTGRGLPEMIAKTAEQAIAIEDTPELTFQLARAYLQMQNFERASSMLQGAVKKWPQSAQLQLALGVAYYGQRRFPQAVEQFLATIRLADEVEQPYIFLGKILDHAGDHLPEIQQRFEALLKRHPDDFMANFLCAKVLIAQPGSDAAAAEQLLRKSIAINSGFWESHFELGVHLAKSGNYPAAEQELVAATKLNPKEAAPHYHLSRVYDRLRKPELASAERLTHQNLTSGNTIQ